MAFNMANGRDTFSSATLSFEGLVGLHGGRIGVCHWMNYCNSVAKGWMGGNRGLTLCRFGFLVVDYGRKFVWVW